MSKLLREDDVLARQVWGHPIYAALIGWVSRYYPDCPNAWDEMAVFALSRVGTFRAGEATTSYVRAGMLDAAWWVGRRGRHGERRDMLDWALPLEDDLPAESGDVDAPLVSWATRRPVQFLESVLGERLSEGARALIDEACSIAQEHYLMLSELTGFHGEDLLGAAQSRVPSKFRRLIGRLPCDWPPAARRAAANLITGTPHDPGLLLHWALVEPDEVTGSVATRWRGMVAVIDPEAGNLPEADRRRLRDRARRWSPDIRVLDDIAV